LRGSLSGNIQLCIFEEVPNSTDGNEAIQSFFGNKSANAKKNAKFVIVLQMCGKCIEVI
jgi:hypothetical protein